MAERRMFSRKIVQSSRFLKMPVSSRELYFQLGMSADDDGIVEAWNVMKLTDAREDDLRVLMSRKYIEILDNDDLIAYLTDWNANNSIRKDRHQDSIYKDLLLKLPDGLEEFDNQLTTICQPSDNQVTTNCQPTVNQTTAQDRLGKDRLGKDRLGEDRLGENCKGEGKKKEDAYSRIKDAWNTLSDIGIKPIRGIDGKRRESVRARVNQYGEDGILEAISNIRASDFLQGKGNKGWVITFDWFIKPNNFPKVLEGNYENNSKTTGTTNDVNRTRQSQFEYLMQSIREDEENERNRS